MPRLSEDPDLDRESYLLVWLSSNTQKYKTLDQACTSNRFLQILLSIDKEHFLPLKSETEFNYAATFQLMELYITQILGKRLKRKLKAAISQANSPIRLSELLLYIAVHSNMKKKFIEEILSLPSGAQSVLMNIIGELNQSIYVLEVTEILQKIDALEIENEKLQEQLEAKESQYTELMEQYNIVKRDFAISQLECQTLKKEKIDTFKELQIGSLEEYVQVFKELQNQSAQTLRSLIRTEQSQKSLRVQLTNSKAKILEDSKLIQQLYQEIDSLKSACRSLRGTITTLPEQQSPLITTNNILKQNKTLSNSIEMQSPKRVMKSCKFLGESQQQLEEQTLRLRYQVIQLTKRLQTYSEIIESQKEVISTYKNDAIKLKKCNEVRKWKLQELQRIHSDLSKIVLTKANDTY